MTTWRRLALVCSCLTVIAIGLLATELGGAIGDIGAWVAAGGVFALVIWRLVYTPIDEEW